MKKLTGAKSARRQVVSTKRSLPWRKTRSEADSFATRSVANALQTSSALHAGPRPSRPARESSSKLPQRPALKVEKKSSMKIRPKKPSGEITFYSILRAMPIKALPIEKIRSLFDAAQALYAADPSISHRLVAKARRIGMDTRTRLPSDLRRRYCHNCYHFLFPGKNARTRIRNGVLVTKCDDCGHLNRF